MNQTKLYMHFVIILTVLLLIACSNSFPADPNNHPIINESYASKEVSDRLTRANSFINSFRDHYPNYTLLDYAIGSEDNSPIILAGIAKNNENNTSSTLFIVDRNGIGIVVLASGLDAHYIASDKLSLSGNSILVSLKVASDHNPRIHDFKLSVSQTQMNGEINTVYTSQETIRN